MLEHTILAEPRGRPCGWRFARCLAESGLFKDNVQRLINPSGKRHRKGSYSACHSRCSFRGKVCPLHFSVLACHFQYDIIDFREYSESSGHIPRIKGKMSLTTGAGSQHLSVCLDSPNPAYACVCMACNKLQEYGIDYTISHRP